MVSIYPGRFDPVTKGHVDITERAASLFETVVVGVYDMSNHSCLFTTDERVDLFRKAVKHLPNVSITPFKGLTVQFAREQKATVLVRGIRALTDFEAEFDMTLMNKKMAPEVESVYLMSSLEHLFVSGHRIREVAHLGQDVTDFVPDHVVPALREKLR